MKCGAPLAPDAQFCSRCGTPVAARVPVTSPAPIPAARRSTWWIVPVVIVGLVLVAWLLLAGLPFGRERRVIATATTETIAEGTSTVRPVEPGTIVDVGEPPFATTTTIPPAQTLPPMTQTVPPVTQTQPVIVEEPAVPRPVPVPPQPIPQPAPREEPEPVEPPGEITESEATSVLRGHLAGANPYGVSSSCLQISSLGYSNTGYTFSVWDACIEGGGSRMLGRWRVDSRTREVFRQRDDGRFVRP